MRICHIYILAITMMSCGSHKQSTMFSFPNSDRSNLNNNQLFLSRNDFTIKPGDLLEIEVYTNDGERIIDPGLELEGVNTTGIKMHQKPQYMVDLSGKLDLPLIGNVMVSNRTLNEFNAFLEKEFSIFYSNPYVISRFLNKRVTVLSNDKGMVIPLTNENTKLSEVLGLAGGLLPQSRSSSIKVLRDQQIFIADFSTFKGWQKSDILIKPDDVIYIDQRPKTLVEGIREFSPLVSIITSIAAIITILLTI